MTRERADVGAFAPRGDVLASVHDRARAAAAAARIGADAEVRAAVAAADVTPPPRASDRVEQASVAVPAGRELPRTTASKVKIDPDVVAIALPAGRVDDETIAPHRAARSGGERMAQPITTPGLGSSTGGSAPGGADTSTHGDAATSAAVEPAVEPAPDAGAPGATPGDGEAKPASSVDEAMLEAELKIAEQKNREVYEREKRRRIVDEQTRGKLAKVEKGSKEHFEVLALRQKWTLPLDDGDYKLWMQQHLLAEHGGALAEQATQLRIDKAKKVARGPLIALAAFALLGAVAALGWWVRGSDVAPGAAVIGTQATGGAPTAGPTAAPAPDPARAEPNPGPGVATTTSPTSADAAPPRAAGAGAATAPEAPPAPAPSVPARPGSTGGGAPASAPAGPRPPAPGAKKDIWEREF